MDKVGLRRISTSGATVVAGAWQIRYLLGASLLLAAAGVVEAAQDAPAYIAGIAPSQRRQDVPVVQQAPVIDRKLAFRGIEEPYPPSLEFIKDQGAWYTPFTHPGMTGKYDIRGYHRRE